MSICDKLRPFVKKILQFFKLFTKQSRPVQITPASSVCWQLWLLKPLCQHSWRKSSLPVQLTSSSQISPLPWPKWAEFGAASASPQPICLQTTWASFRSQWSSHTVPQAPRTLISTRPEHCPLPPTSRTGVASVVSSERGETLSYFIKHTAQPNNTFLKILYRITIVIAIKWVLQKWENSAGTWHFYAILKCGQWENVCSSLSHLQSHISRWFCHHSHISGLSHMFHRLGCWDLGWQIVTNWRTMKDHHNEINL